MHPHAPMTRPAEQRPAAPARRRAVPPRADPRVLRELDLEEHLADPAIKQDFVTPMFDVIAPRYDRFTRLFSFGMDRGWKRELLVGLDRVAPADASVLDIGTGTGDLALDVAARLPHARVTGIDASPAMVGTAERRRPPSVADRVQFVVGDMTRIPAADASVDLATAGYALRNAPDHGAALAELARVLKPGGRLLVLDFYRPEHAVWRRLFVTYLRVAGAIFGWVWHRVPVVYAYLGPSVAHFVSWRQFSDSLVANGFEVQHVTPKLLGGIAIHRARRT